MDPTAANRPLGKGAPPSREPEAEPALGAGSSAGTPVGRKLPAGLVSPAAILFGLGLLLFPGVATASHPFYEQLLREGSSALSRGDYDEAQELLRLASFGFLSEPEKLAGSLVRLAVAEAEGGKTEAFQKTFGRILEIEERFGAYSRSSPDDELTLRFEEILAHRVPRQTLRSTSAFRPIARRLELEHLRDLPRNERRQTLQALVAEAPADSETVLMLAQLELQAGDAAAAARVLEELLRRRPGHSEAGCLLGLAQAQAGRCAAAIERLEACTTSPGEEGLATALLECYVSAERWLEASSFLRRLEPAVAGQRPVVRLEKRIRRGARRAVEQPEPLGDDPEAAEPATRIASGSETTTPGEPPPAKEPVLPPDTGARSAPGVETPRPARAPPAPAESMSGQPSEEEQAKLDEARRQLTRARLATDLESAMALAKGVADRYPEASDAQQLVAEIAYRASRWKEAAEYFRRGGDPGDERPNLLFFMAVSLYESGDLEGARSALRRCLPQLQKTPFVREYALKILSEES